MKDQLYFSCISSNAWNKIKTDSKFVPLCKKHMEHIRHWRNEQIRILRQQTPLSFEDQERYWDQVLVPLASLAQPSQILFAIEEQENLMGYCGLTHIDWSSGHAECSFLLATEIAEHSTQFSSVFNSFLQSIEYLAREELHFSSLTCEVFAFRKTLIAHLKNHAFVEMGKFRSYVKKNGKEYDSIFFQKQLFRYPKNAILLTSIFKKEPLITAIRNSMGALGERFRLIGCDTNSSCLSKHSVDQFWLAPSWNDLQDQHTLLSFCKQHHIRGIIPTRDKELTFFASLKDPLRQEGIAILSSPLSTISKCQDKWAFMQFCVQHQLPAIASYLSIHDLPSNFCGYIVKERFSFTPKKLHLCKSKEEIIAQSSSLKNPLFQPKIEGIEYSIDIYRSKQNNQTAALVRRRDLVLYTEAYITTPIHHPRLEMLTKKAAELLDIQGHALFQAIETNLKELYFIECNPRIGGASTAAFANGLDSLEWFIEEEMLGRKVTIQSPTLPFFTQLRVRQDIPLVTVLEKSENNVIK